MNQSVLSFVVFSCRHLFSRNDLDMVQLLLRFGADPLLYDSRSRCAYDLANKEVGSEGENGSGF